MEEEIEQILLADHPMATPPYFWSTARLKQWHGRTWSYLHSGPDHLSSSLYEAWEKIDSLIKNADLALCLTSRYVYIRECKKALWSLVWKKK
jgi:hypothetical protein